MHAGFGTPFFRHFIEPLISTFMTLIEKTAYPIFRKDYTSSALNTYFNPTKDEIRFVSRNTRYPKGKLTLLVLLKTHQHLGRTTLVHHIPLSIISYLRDHIELSEEIHPLEEDALNKKRFYRYRQFIRAYLQVKSWSAEAEHIIIDVVSKVAYTMSDPADLINAALEALSDNRYELPAFSTIERLVKHIRQGVHEQIYKQVASSLDASQKEALNELLIVGEVNRQSGFTQMKNTPGKTTIQQMRQWSQRIKWLCSIIEPGTILIQVPHTKVRQFAAQAEQLELGDMKDISHSEKRYTLLLCFLYHRQTTTRDELINMFLKRMRKLHRRAKEELKLIHEHHRKWEEQMMSVFNQVLLQATPSCKDAALGKNVRTILESSGGVDYLTQQYQMLAAYHANNHFPLLWAKHKAQRSIIFE
ncbi:MAG: hypothetical protein ACJA01_003745 [Saprospiraceae bacterium]